MKRQLSALLVVPALTISGPSDLTTAPAQESGPPNIVFILTDDLSTNLLPYMREVQRMSEDGVSFERFFVSNSLCCPSRATVQTGQYPHNHGVVSNLWPTGGFGQFMEHGHLDSSLGTYLQAAGYRTGLYGKYLNGYDPQGDGGGSPSPDYPPEFVPPGWDEWFVSADGYLEFGYSALMSIDGVGRTVRAGRDSEDYLTDRMASSMEEFVDRAAGDPFFLMLAPFAPHSSKSRAQDPQQPGGYLFPPAPRDRASSPNRPEGWGPTEFPSGDCGEPIDGGCRDIVFPDPAWEDFNVVPSNPPRWAPRTVLSPAQIQGERRQFVERVQMIQSVDDLIGRVRAKLTSAGVADNTYVIFTSDNGFHLGEHALIWGKLTAYDHDTRVPLVVVPPAGGLGGQVQAMASNVDILPTFLDIAGAPVPEHFDGQSLHPAMLRPLTADPRALLIEHEEEARDSTFDEDPDVMRRGASPVPRYRAVRTEHYLYVDYSKLDASPPVADRGEFYWLANDPYQIDNRWSALNARQQAALNSYLLAYASCAGETCRRLSGEAPAITP